MSAAVFRSKLFRRKEVQCWVCVYGCLRCCAGLHLYDERFNLTVLSALCLTVRSFGISQLRSMAVSCVCSTGAMRIQTKEFGLLRVIGFMFGYVHWINFCPFASFVWLLCR